MLPRFPAFTDLPMAALVGAMLRGMWSAADDEREAALRVCQKPANLVEEQSGRHDAVSNMAAPNRDTLAMQPLAGIPARNW